MFWINQAKKADAINSPTVVRLIDEFLKQSNYSLNNHKSFHGYLTYCDAMNSSDFNRMLHDPITGVLLTCLLYPMNYVYNVHRNKRTVRLAFSSSEISIVISAKSLKSLVISAQSANRHGQVSHPLCYGSKITIPIPGLGSHPSPPVHQSR